MVGRSYTDEYMRPIVERILAGEEIIKLVTETGVCHNTILKYVRKLAGGRPPPKPHSTFKQYVIPPPILSPPVMQPVISQSIPRRIPPPSEIPPNSTVLAISDMHHPFTHPDALAFLLEVRRTKHTNLTVCLGDEIDAASFSRYIPDPDGMAPGQELSKAIESLIPFYREFPEVLVCESNHTVRPWKKAFEAGLPASFLPTYATLLKAPDGWHWASKWEVDGVLYIHGDNGKSGAYAHINYMKAAKKSVVIGHIHSYAGVNYEASHFAVNAGCLIDESAYCFKYAKNMLVKVNLGCAVIYEGKYAEFVPMRLDANGRWIGRL